MERPTPLRGSVADIGGLVHRDRTSGATRNPQSPGPAPGARRGILARSSTDQDVSRRHGHDHRRALRCPDDASARSAAVADHLEAYHIRAEQRVVVLVVILPAEYRSLSTPLRLPCVWRGISARLLPSVHMSETMLSACRASRIAWRSPTGSLACSAHNRRTIVSMKQNWAKSSSDPGRNRSGAREFTIWAKVRLASAFNQAGGRGRPPLPYD
jgi:hypothetical protein